MSLVPSVGDPAVLPPAVAGRPRGGARRLPYLLDPAQKTWAAWGLGRRAHGPGYYVRALLAGSKMERPPASEVGPMKPALTEIPGLLADEDTGLYVVDRQGVVRHVLAEGQYVHDEGDRPRVLGSPSTDETLAAIQVCDR